MAIVKPAKPRSTIVDGPRGLEVIIPARRNLFLLAFLGVWLVGWSVGWIGAFSQVRSGNIPGEILGFLSVWLVFWTLGGVVAAVGFLWSLAGRERITLGASHLGVAREVFALRWSREYELTSIRNLRVGARPVAPFGFGARSQLLGASGGVIAFDYGARTVRCAAGIDEAEAQTIVDRLKQRHPFDSREDASFR